MTNTKTVTLWQIGSDQSLAQIELKQGKWFSEYNYTVEIDRDPINHPSIPQLLAIPHTQANSQEHLATGKLNIYFTLDHSYQAEELTLFYGCFGMQESHLLLDGQILSNLVIKSSCEKLQQLEIALPEMTVGDHILTIKVSGEQQNPDYQTISYLKLEALTGGNVELLPVSNPWQQLAEELKPLEVWSMLS